MLMKWIEESWVRNCQRLRWRTAWARVLPDFVIIGGMKCGTTSLYETLVQHPQIVAARRKEVHYFDNQYSQGLNWYRTYFPLAPYLLSRRVMSGKPVITGEGTPYYLFHPHVASRLHAAVPQTKLIALLRNPVDRAYSHYRHNLHYKQEPLSFDEALAREDERLSMDRMRLRGNETQLSESYRKFSYVARGIYVDQLLAYHALFPKEQLLVIKAEDYFVDPGRIIRQVLLFLGLGDELPVSMNLPGRVPPQAVPVAAAARLGAFFAPHNQRLYEHLGQDLGWDRRLAYNTVAA